MKKITGMLLGVALVFAVRGDVMAKAVDVDSLVFDAKIEFDVVSAEHLQDIGAKDVTGDRLYANVTMGGIKPGEKFEYYFRWTSPNPDAFESSEYPEAEDRDTGKKNLYAGDDACDEPETRCQCYCKYQGEDAVKAGVAEGTIVRGCWRSRAYRTINWTSAKGKVFTAVGTWTVDLIRVGTNGAKDVVLASAQYEVN
jgi:hypothetical protein